MNKILFAIFLTLSSLASAATYFVSTSGSNTYSGTSSRPFLTIQYGVDHLTSPGDILYIRGGVYSPSGLIGVSIGSGIGSGSPGNTKKVYAYQGETVILDCSNLTGEGTHFGIYVSGVGYWDFKGINIRNLKEYNSSFYGIGWQTLSCNNLLIEQCSVYNSACGFFDNYGNAIEYLNCDAYNNADLHDSGDLANGFTVHTHGTNKILFEGCRAWANCDDGFDLYGSSGYITIKHCWAFGNGPGNAYNGYQNGNGDGFKTGANDTQVESGVQRIISNCLAWGNLGAGFDKSQDNGPVMLHYWYHNISYNNTVAFNWQRGGSNDIIRNNIAYTNSSFYPISTDFILDHNNFTNNSQNGAIKVTDADFLSLSPSGMDGARQEDGSLPDLDFLKLSSTSGLKDKGVDVGLPFTGSAPDLGAFETQGTQIAAIPTYLNSAIENTSPNIIEITYSLTLANIIPPTSAFTVIINSVTRSVNKVDISGAKVLLTMTSPIAYGDVVTLAYTTPSSNPIQTAGSGQASTFSAQRVDNRVNPDGPIYISSVIENITPTILEITFNEILDNTTPSLSAFSVLVNGVSRGITLIAISGKKVRLTLESAVLYGDIVTFSYTKPANNQLQKATGGAAINIGPQLITKNNVEKKNTISIYPNPARDFINITQLKNSSDPKIIKIFDFSGRLYLETKCDPFVSDTRIPINLKSGPYLVQVLMNSLILYTQKLIVVE